MPIYAYQCGTCGHAKDVLQKMSDAPLTDCPACGAQTCTTQLTAAGFQLMGSGWYQTDFRGGTAAPAAAAGATAGAGSGEATAAGGAVDATVGMDGATAADVAGAAATTTAPAGTGRCKNHQVPPAATAATATTATATSTGLMADRPATGMAPGTGTAGVWMPGTAPRPRSASARRSASRM